MLATQVLPEDTVDNVSQDKSEIVGHLVINSKRFEIRRGENKIGRDPHCSIVIENCTISKLHAVIESDGRDETFIYDCGSTNSSKLKKTKLRPYCRYKLDDRMEIVFGNAVATFELAPKINFREVKARESTSVNTQVLEELNDIFDLSTQATVPKPSTSRDILEPRDSFKIPNFVMCDKKQPTQSDCNSDSGFSRLENSEIFNLSTQCQLPKLTSEYANDDSDKIKSLLNDGHDEVLCSFMSMGSPKCDDETEIDIFDGPTQVDVVGASANEDLKNAQIEKSVSEITAASEEEGSIDTQKFDEVTKEVYEVEKEGKKGETDEEDDVIFTQKFELLNDETSESVLETNINDQKKDSVEIKQSGDVAKDNLESYNKEEDKKPLQKTDGENYSDSATQIYKTGFVEFSERIESILSNSFKQNEAKPAEDSGDETISDLEIDNEKSFVIDQALSLSQLEPQMEDSQNSNDSYTFEIDLKLSEKDCKVEPPEASLPEVVREENQVLTQTPSSNAEVNIPMQRRSPSPECWGPLSLEMPCTQDLEYTIEKFLGRENQVGNEQTNSPLKRNRDSIGSVDASPAKKPKSDKKLSKLWQVHDVAQIQPTRTRNSSRTPGTNKQSCRRSTRARKSNSDITPYLIRCRKKKESPKESTKVLRSRKVELFKTSARKRTKIDTPVVMFTGFKSENQEKIMRELGGEKTNDLSLASVVVADKVRRTVKFLCAIGLSLPITSPQWLTSSKKERKFLNPLNFILKDEDAEDKWKFNLKSSLERSKRIKLLEGYNVFATKNTKPPVKDLLVIVECCGGTPIVHRPNIWPKKTIIVSCEEDKEVWPSPKVRNIKLVHYEFILSGVLRQKIDFKSYSLR